MRQILPFVLSISLFLFIPGAHSQVNKSVAQNLIFVSGQRTGLMEVPDDSGKALREAFDKIRDIAKKNNASMDDIVQMTILLADPAQDYPRLRNIVPEYFKNPGNVARSVVGVERIPDNDAVNFDINRRVEIDAIIAIKGQAK